MRRLAYGVVYPGIVNFEVNEFNIVSGKRTEFWEEVEKRFGIVLLFEDRPLRVKITNEDKYLLFQLRYSDVL